MMKKGKLLDFCYDHPFLLVAVLIIICMLILVGCNKIIWNDGNCSRCKVGQYQFISGTKDRVYYECDNCGYIIWTSYPMR